MKRNIFLLFLVVCFTFSLNPANTVASEKWDEVFLVGVFGSLHFLDRSDLNSELKSYDLDDFTDSQLSGGADFRAFLGWLVLEGEIEAFTSSQSSDLADVNISGYDILGNVGFSPMKNSKTKVYVLAGLGYNSLDIEVESKIARTATTEEADRSGLIGNVAVGVDYFIDLNDKGLALPVFGRVGYMGEILQGDWSDDLTDDLDHDFTGLYVRFGVGFAFYKTDSPGKSVGTKSGKTPGSIKSGNKPGKIKSKSDKPKIKTKPNRNKSPKIKSKPKTDRKDKIKIKTDTSRDDKTKLKLKTKNGKDKITGKPKTTGDETDNKEDDDDKEENDDDDKGRDK